MPQKLSAMKYIKNNKRRVSVLIVSLSLCFMLTYLLNFLLLTTVESFKVFMVDNTEKIQYIRLPGSAYGISDETENYSEAYYRETMNLMEKLREQEGICEVFYPQIIYAYVTAVVGSYTFEIPCVKADEVPILLEHMGAELKEGRLPNQPGEVVLDENLMKNNNYQIGDKFYLEDFTIVGVLNCDTYFGCGIQVDKEAYQNGREICVLSDGSISDMTALLHKMGYQFDKESVYICDAEYGKKHLKQDISDQMEYSLNLVYVAVLIILSISLVVIYTMYMRDRYNEWCLYCSIGYTRKSIYFSIMRELLFTFVTALVIGSILLILSMAAANFAIIRPIGLRCRYFYPKVLGQILCSYVLIFGILQVPVRCALYKICTIDAMEDDLY